MSNKKAVQATMKKWIIAFAREFNLDTGHVIPKGPFMMRVGKLNPVQKDAVFEALETLVNDGIFDDKGENFILTEKGRNELYM